MAFLNLKFKDTLDNQWYNGKYLIVTINLVEIRTLLRTDEYWKSLVTIILWAQVIILRLLWRIVIGVSVGLIWI